MHLFTIQLDSTSDQSTPLDRSELAATWTRQGTQELRDKTLSITSLINQPRKSTCFSGKSVIFKSTAYPAIITTTHSQHICYIFLPNPLVRVADLIPMVPNGPGQTLVLLESLAVIADQITRAKPPE